MASTYGKDRSKIYDYLKTQGLEFNEKQHEELKALLIEYVNHQNANLQVEVTAWHNHQPRCEMFLARKARRAFAKRSATQVPQTHAPKTVTKTKESS